MFANRHHLRLRIIPSAAPVAEWTEDAAGDVAKFTVEGYQVARGALKVAGKWIYEQIANYFYETLPHLGGLNPKAREVAAYLLTDAVVRGIEAVADAMGCVLTLPDAPQSCNTRWPARTPAIRARRTRLHSDRER